MKRTILIIIILLSMFGISGCWDLEEADRRVYMTALGIDVINREKIELTAQIPLPRKLRAPSSSVEDMEKIFTTYSIMEKTVQSAFDHMHVKATRDLSAHQNRTIVFGEETACQGVKPLIDFFTRCSSVPQQMTVYIADAHTAKEIVSFNTAHQLLPGVELDLSAQIVDKSNFTYYLPIWLFNQKLVHKSKDTYASLISYNQEEKTLIQEGLGVFNGDKMVGKLSPEETQLFGLITNQMKMGTLNMDIPDGNLITLRNVNANTSIKVIVNDGAPPFFQVRIKIAGALNEVLLEKRITPKYILQLQKGSAAYLKPRFEALIGKLQILNSDVIDFGEMLRVQHYKEWKRINWKEIYPQVPFSVSVDVLLERSGIIF